MLPPFQTRSVIDASDGHCKWIGRKYTYAIIWFPEGNLKKRGQEVKKDDLAESPVINLFSVDRF